MFGVITSEQFQTFSKGKIPESIPTEMKDCIQSLKQSDGGFAFFTLTTCQPYWNEGTTEHYIEYVCSEDSQAFDNVIKL